MNYNNLLKLHSVDYSTLPWFTVILTIHLNIKHVIINNEIVVHTCQNGDEHDSDVHEEVEYKQKVQVYVLLQLEL
ncbi:hypothetical protein MtrunA17_Chr6g0452851 [Medicago truncatula]|uniref:Uncharacterized protein n=1 Tax=Medicago truncatula TaxID=3880 RepID=A0A396HDX3_MEDTR|nr:hypothetical protein MtrunA17_Chr6g0452851 [Medicago truncatula]